MTNLPELGRLLHKYKYDDSHNPYYGYGTAGFRFLAVELPPIMVRVGMAVASVDGIAGVMITASHNTAEYNGVKLANANGGMIDESQEQLAVELVNDRTIERILREVSSHKSSHKTVYIGRDTREHSMHLSCLVQSAIRATDATIRIVNVGQVTTPQLHYLVRQDSIVRGIIHVPSTPSFVGLDGYDQSIIQAYRLLVSTVDDHTQRGKIHVDCANGVGHQHLCRLQSLGLDFIIPRNGEGPLNENCGSEYVQKNQLPPRWYDGDEPPTNVMYCASFDGDADRIVFFKNDILLDGDKIASLIGNFIRKQLNTLGDDTLRMGVVQTAYANGASTNYLQDQNVQVVLAKTGVKFVHKAAHDAFDIGVYFEANGHGTVLFNEPYYHLLRDARPTTVEGRRALVRLHALPLLINQAVGDAISDLLLVDAILQIENITVEQWSGLYKDLPSKQSKVSVPDRTIIQTNDTETRCIQPDGLQDALDRAISGHGEKARAFIRPSGTENVVRVYAEANSDPETLAKAAEDIVRQFCSLSKI